MDAIRSPPVAYALLVNPHHRQPRRFQYRFDLILTTFGVSVFTSQMTTDLRLAHAHPFRPMPAVLIRVRAVNIYERSLGFCYAARRRRGRRLSAAPVNPIRVMTEVGSGTLSRSWGTCQPMSLRPA